MKLRRFSAFFVVGFFVVLLSILFSSKPVSSEWGNDLEAPTTTFTPPSTCSPISGGNYQCSGTSAIFGLVCADNPPPPSTAASQCSSPPTYYKVNGTTCTRGTGVFNTGNSIIVNGPSTTTICVYSLDNAWNYENAHSIQVSFTTLTPPPTLPPPTNPPTPTNTPIPPTNTPISAIPTPFSKWFQGIGGDMREDQSTGFQDAMTASSSLEASIKSLAGTIRSLTHGVIFSEKGSPNFGIGRASENNWVVKNSSGYSGALQRNTSYDRLDKLDITKNTVDSSSPCAGSGCNFTSFTSGVYKRNGSFIVNAPGASGAVVPGGRTIVIIAEEDIFIQSNITLAANSYLLMSAKGDIKVDGSVTRMEGFYSADKEFIFEDPPSPQQLVVEGLVVVNAGGTGSILQQKRRHSPPTEPAILFVERPDLILNTPDFLKKPTYIWQEVAP